MSRARGCALPHDRRRRPLGRSRPPRRRKLTWVCAHALGRRDRRRRGSLSRTTDGGTLAVSTRRGRTATTADLGACSSSTRHAAGPPAAGEILADDKRRCHLDAPRSSNTTENLNGLNFSDPDNGWAVGDQGTIVHTSDGGANWTAQSSGTSYQLTGVTFTDAQDGWATGQSFTPYDDYSSGLILHSTDGGQDWTSSTPRPSTRTPDRQGSLSALSPSPMPTTVGQWARPRGQTRATTPP